MCVCDSSILVSSPKFTKWVVRVRCRCLDLNDALYCYADLFLKMIYALVVVLVFMFVCV